MNQTPKWRRCSADWAGDDRRAANATGGRGCHPGPSAERAEPQARRVLGRREREREAQPAVTCVAGVEPPRGTNGVPSATSKSGEQSAPGDGGDDGDARRPILRARARFESGFRHRGRPYCPHTPLQVPSMPKTPARNRRRSGGRCCLLAGRTTAPISALLPSPGGSSAAAVTARARGRSSRTRRWRTCPQIRQLAALASARPPAIFGARC
jgi:hypothetical protein